MTTPDFLTHGEQVQSLLVQVEAKNKAILKLGMCALGYAGADMYTLDFLVIGAIKRYLNTSAAFRLMIETRNMSCVRALLRMHIDTALRFSAAWLVEDSQAFASKVLGGERIDKLKGRNGKRLSDAHLVKVHAMEHPCLPEVYKNLSSYIHFSASQIFDSVATLDESSHTLHFHITDNDMKFPDSSWVELLQCFIEMTEMLEKYIDNYVATKHRLPPSAK